MRSLKILIPNALTLLRLFVGIVIIWFLFSKNITNLQITGALLLLALFTDLIDGPITRKLKVVTQFGYYFDHIVDFS